MTSYPQTLQGLSLFLPSRQEYANAQASSGLGDKAQWLAQHWARPTDQGQWCILGHAAHKIINAQLFRVEEILGIYERIRAPMLCVVAQEDSLSQWWKEKYTLAEFKQRIASVPDLQHRVIDDAGHMLHHDQPQKLAALVESFFCDGL